MMRGIALWPPIALIHINDHRMHQIMHALKIRSFLLFLILFSSAVEAQTNTEPKPTGASPTTKPSKQADTSAQSVDLNTRLASIELKLEELLKRKPASAEPAQNDELKKLKEDTARLSNEVEELKKSKFQLDGSLKFYKDSLAVARRKAAACESQATTQTKELTKQLEGEIAAVTTMGEEVPDALLESMLRRSNELSPTNRKALEQFNQGVDLLRDARNVLTKAPDTSRNAVLAKMRDLDMKTFPELEKDRQDLLKLLEKYCQRSKDLATRITDAAGLSGERRTSFLEDARYLTKDCPYLKDQLEKALKDPSYLMPAPNCN